MPHCRERARKGSSFVMIDVNRTDPLLIAVVFALAGVVKGVIGLGLPTIAVGLLGLA